LLDLPSEALTLLEIGRLTEGHGRALLLADDQEARRRLARAAADGGWSVRVTEDRARRANELRVSRGAPGRSGMHPDQAAACEQIAETLSAALGREVRVRPRGTAYKVELGVSDADDARSLAGRVRGALAT
jgi:ParB family chromosome partitioning protein